MGTIVNWADIIADLRGKRMTQAEIGAACGLSQAFVSNLYSGARKDVLYSHGARLLQLWRERVGNKCHGGGCMSEACPNPTASASKEDANACKVTCNKAPNV